MTSKDIEIRYCPSGEMIADLPTKPLQETLFDKLKDNIMNIQDENDSQKCVERIGS